MERKSIAMNAKLNRQQLVVSGFWAGKTGDYSMMLYTPDRMAAAKLSSILFAWHSSSWYGTSTEEIVVGERLLIKLTPLTAIDYLSDPQPVKLVEVKWSDQLQVLMKLAGLFRELLLNGWFLPDWERWSEYKRCWRPAIPKERHDINSEWEALQQQAEAFGDQAISLWLSEAIEELLANNHDVQQAWEQAERSVGSGLLARKLPDEQDWLTAIGLLTDSTPFRIALQLLEPSAGDCEEWRLVPAVQAREGGPWQAVYYHKRAELWRPLLEEHAELPSLWQPLLTEKIGKEHQKWLAALHNWELEQGDEANDWKLTEEEALNFLHEGSMTLLEAGCSVLLPSWWEEARSRKLRVKAKMKHMLGSAAEPMFGLSQIVQFDWRLAVGDLQLSEEEFLKLAEEKRRFIQVGESWVYLDPQDAAQIKMWLRKVGRGKGLTFRDVLELHLRGEASFLTDYEDMNGRAEIEMNEHLQIWMEQLQNISSMPLVDKPSALHGELREYQRQGLSWLLFLRRYGLGGVLADDMGLGKTIQFIAYLAYLKQERLAHGSLKAAGHAEEALPSLLICPTSVIGNWEKELERFAPDLNIELHYGAKRQKGEEFKELAGKADLVITSYAIALLDQEQFVDMQWDALCLDEAQNIKNAYTKGSSAIRQFPAQHRIALTGTPMENRLTELWSIYDFINPGYLGSLGEFHKSVVIPIERTRDEQLIAGLKRWVQPFMLRRLKKDPAIQLALPDKIESKAFVTLTAEQGAIYEHIVADLMEKLHTLDPMQRRGMVLAALTKLKQLCDHPSLFLNEGGLKRWEEERSNKMVRLLELIEEIAAEGERCLIFTQYIEMGEQLKRILEARFKLEVPFLHGAVPKQKRDQMIERFQNEQEDCLAFVLSLKAGGTGLNLTAANHVFHFDRWWNPAVENQATDRAFRIGQTKNVQVHKLVTLGTLEEKIDTMIDSKQSLNDQVVGQSEQWITELSNEELRELFALRKNWLKG